MDVGVSVGGGLSGVEDAPRGCVVVIVDVFRTTTMLATSLAQGRRCFVAATPEEARHLAAALRRPLLAGEVAGEVPAGFELDNSPSALWVRSDVERPLVLVSSQGAPLIRAAGVHHRVYAATFCNYRAVAEHLARLHPRVAVIGAGSRGRPRDEDELCAARLVAELLQRGLPAVPGAEEAVRRWRDVPIEAVLAGESVAWLERSGHHVDVRFVLDQVDDVAMVPELVGEAEIVDIWSHAPEPSL